MSVDMSKVQLGTLVRLRNGNESKILDTDNDPDYPFLSEYGGHKPNGCYCVPTNPQFDIVKILDDDAPEVHERTLRDEFAMAALTGFTANPNTCSSLDDETTANLCYKAADAMMKAREPK